MKTVASIVAAALFAVPAIAQNEHSVPASKPSVGPSETPQACTMMHHGMKMRGMMMKGKDGKMSCQMMMDHSTMAQSKMDHMKMPSENPSAEQSSPQPQ
ncbi:hypothetical protein GRI58_06515 [Porphyrobacter algicida]|uniref:Pentapeptide MXKDX repeat protein n=1 Tax=Qipengyuania algicida TaxID=1836209 RepID=A0A845AFR5_9SPHN|nr:hypothetical protein [Qipengyuania algicida]MXP28474.1 hypothetical protein [Qipengyuania algicida]